MNTNGVLLPVAVVLKDEEKRMFGCDSGKYGLFPFFGEHLQRTGAAEVAMRADVKRVVG